MYPTIELIKNADKSVSGMLPCGSVVRWDRDNSNKPTKRNKKVMVNCSQWSCVWVDKFSKAGV